MEFVIGHSTKTPFYPSVLETLHKPTLSLFSLTFACFLNISFHSLSVKCQMTNLSKKYFLCVFALINPTVICNSEKSMI